MELYNYFRSSAAYRVRIALHVKGITYDEIPIHLLRNGGEQHLPAYREMNPQGLVPTLIDDGLVLSQSLAIIEYLDETHPEPPLLPASPADRARVRSWALQIACDLHPLNNLRVLSYLTATLGVDETQKAAWYRHWAELGLSALEQQLAARPEQTPFCHGDAPTLADLCVVPQLFNARRFGVDLTPYPILVGIDAVCCALPAFAAAAPAEGQ